MLISTVGSWLIMPELRNQEVAIIERNMLFREIEYLNKNKSARRGESDFLWKEQMAGQTSGFYIICKNIIFMHIITLHIEI